MKQLFCAIAASLTGCVALAQSPISISSLPIISPGGKVDSCNVPTPAALSSLPSLAPAINGSWDLSGTALQATPFTYLYKAKTAGFAAATFSDSLAYVIGTTAGIGYNAWRNVQQSPTGVVILGEEILKRQAKSLGAATGNNVDSIVFGQQAIAFSTPLPVIKFPATMSSSWAVTTNRVVNFTLTVTAASLNNAPGQHKQIRSHLDSVVGWGRMKVPVVGKGPSAWIPVLQMQHREVAVDSFFVNGAAASATLLTAIGASQGQSSTVSRTYFYRAAAFRPLVEAVHSGPAHSSPVSNLYMHAVDVPDATGVHPPSVTGDVRVYPAPLRDGRLHIDVPGNIQAGWSYSLINITGQIVTAGDLQLSAAVRTTTISLPPGAGAGIYYLTLKAGGTEIGVLPVTVE